MLPTIRRALVAAVLAGAMPAAAALPDQAASPLPEPEVWAFLIVGFGLVGTALRRRNAEDA